MWLSNGGAVSPTITFDLGSSYNITQFHLWNYNEDNGYNGTGRGASSADISVSTTGLAGSFTVIDSAQALSRADGSGTDPGATVSLASTGVRYVQFHLLNNFSNGTGFDNQTGLGEIRFVGTASTPEPASLGVLASGSLIVLTRRRRA
jgi:hypothetical protein